MAETLTRRLLLRADPAQLRTATFEGREHLVVPVVALREGVMHAVNAPGPELVEAAELERAPQGWNGRPCVGGHPRVNGREVSANQPQVLEQHAFGQVFHALVEDGKLKLEAWLDQKRARPGTVAERVMERLRQGQVVEVSVGVFMSAERRSGVHDGERYEAVWRDIVPDHLAFLPEGDTGACSVEMGCGAPRAAEAVQDITIDAPDAEAFAEVLRRHVVGIAEAKEVGPMAETNEQPGQAGGEPAPRRTLRERFIALLGSWRGSQDADEAQSDRDLRQALHAALFAVEPGFLGIDSVFPDDRQVVYGCAPEEQVMMFRRSYDVAADGAVTLNDDREEVRQVTRFEPVRAAEAQPATEENPAAGGQERQQEQRAACGCQSKEGEGAMDKAARITALIEQSNGRFSEADRPWLDQVPEERLEVLAADKPATPPTPPAPAPTSTPSPTAPPSPAPNPAPGTPSGQPTTTRQTAPDAPLTAEQYVAAAPPMIRDFLADGMRAAQERRDAIVRDLKATGRCPFSDEQLAAKGTDELMALAQLAAVPPPPAVDYSGRGTPRAAAQAAGVPDPPSLIDRVAEARRNQATRH